MSVSSVNKYLNRAASVFTFAVKNGYMDKNPAFGMGIKQPKRVDQLRDVFSPDDLRRLFFSEEYVGDAHRSSYRFWVPVIGLFSGMRLEEICQLHLSDIRQETGIWVFDINNTREKNIKTPSSLRLVPLHRILTDDLHLPEYAESLRQQGHDRLFRELQARREGYSQTVSKWFGRYRQRCGIVVAEGRKDFHSFRHSVADALKQAGVEPTMIAELLGHEVPSITMGRYGKRYNPKVLFDNAISKLKFDVDLSHLSASKYISR